MQKDAELIKNEIEYQVAKRGGYRPGAGRPRGSTNALTRKADKKEKTIKERVLKNVDDLVNAQLTLAKGVHYLYEIKMRNIGGRRKPEHILVTDPKRIKKFLDGELEGEYCYITADKPDGRMIDSLLDRAFGKASQSEGNDTNFNFNIVNYDKQLKEGEIYQDRIEDNNSV